MAVDWLAIKNDYINGGGSYRELAEKYSVPLRTLAQHAKDEEWQQAKKQHCNSIATALQQKSQEKISEALSEEAASKVRIRARLLRLGEEWLNGVAEIADTYAFRRMVQSFADMGVFEKDVSEYTQGTETADDPLTKALKEEAERLNNAD